MISLMLIGGLTQIELGKKYYSIMNQSQNRTKEQIRLISEKEGLRVNATKISQIMKGKVNKIFIVKKGIVLRFSDDSTSPKRLIKEAELLKDLRDKIPVPEVYSYGSINNIGYQILSMMPGDRLSDVWPKLSKSNKVNIVSQLSIILNKLHSIKKTKYKTICIPSTEYNTWTEYYDRE